MKCNHFNWETFILSSWSQYLTKVYSIWKKNMHIHSIKIWVKVWGKSQRIRELAVRLCLLIVSPLKSHQNDCQNVSWTKIKPIVMLTGWGKCITPPTHRPPHTKDYGNWGVEEVLFPREELVSSAKQSNLKTHIQVTLCGLSILYLGIYMYIHIHSHTQQWLKKRGCKFDQEQGKIYVAVWGKERKGRNVILLQREGFRIIKIKIEKMYL